MHPIFYMFSKEDFYYHYAGTKNVGDKNSRRGVTRKNKALSKKRRKMAKASRRLNRRAG